MIPLFDYSALWQYQANDNVVPVDPSAVVVPVTDWLGPEPGPFGAGPGAVEYPIATAWPVGTGLWIRRAVTLDRAAPILISGQIENACYVYFDGIYVGAVNPSGAQRTDVPMWQIVIPAELATVGVHELALLCQDEASGLTNTYVFAEGEYMPAAFPLWPRAPMGETLEWLTDAIIAGDGTEDRAQMRLTPRQSLNMDFYVPVSEQPRLKNLLWGNRAGQWLVPFWPHIQNVGALPAGQWSLTLPTEWVDFRNYGLAMIWQSSDNFQVVGIDRVTNTTTIVLNQPTQEFSDAWVVPIRRGFTPGDPTRQFDGKKSSISMSFIIEENRQLTVAAPTQYLAQDIYFDAGLLDGGGLGETITAPMDIQDEALGRVSYSTPWDHVRPRRPLKKLADGLEEGWAMRQWLHRRVGRLRAFWHPSFEADLILQSTGALTTTILVRSDEYLRWAADRNHIAVETTTGWLARAITLATQIDADTVQLTLNASLAVNASVIQRISWLGLWRLDADRIEINWIGGQVSGVTIPVLELEP